MNTGDVIIWGFCATLLLTIIMSVAKPLGYSRMDLPFILGTLFTSNRNRAVLYGFISHLVIGWLFAFLYAVIFLNANIFTWWFGVVVGFFHAMFVLTGGLQIIAAMHPRMAQPYRGPTPTRQLEPPGFFALNYGRGTPFITLIAHLLYGAILGAMLQVQ